MRTSTIAAVLVAATLAACGGGGGDNGGGFTLSGQAGAFTAVEQGMPPAPQSWILTVTGPKVVYVGAGYLDGSPLPSWLDVGLTAAAHPPGTWNLEVTILRTDLAPRTYTSTFQVGTADGNGNILATKDFTVTYVVTPHPPVLRVDQAEVVLGGADGIALEPATLSFRLDSSVIAACDYTATPSTSSGGDWLHAGPATGAVGPAGTSLQVGAQAGLPGGTYAGQVRLACTADGTPLEITVPVTLNVEASRLVVGTEGVGFSSAPSRSVLARDVRVRSSTGRADVAWEAASDQGWLTVTAAGTTAGSLHLSADPAGLAAGTTYFATVTITSPDPTVENQQRIRVGLAVRDADPAPASQARAGGSLVSSPVEPVVFVAAEGGILGPTDVVAYDVYSGAVVRTFAGVATQIAALVISGDGRSLFVWDIGAKAVLELDAVTGALVRTFDSTPVTFPGFWASVAWVRPAGAPVLVTPSGKLYDLGTGDLLPDRFDAAVDALNLAASQDGSRVATDTGAVYRFRRTALAGGRTWGEYEWGTTYTGYGMGHAAFGAGDARLYVATGGLAVLDAVTFGSVGHLTGPNYPNAVAGAWNGLVVVGTSDYYQSADDVWIFDDATAALLGTLNSTGVAGASQRSLLGRGLAVSADGTRVVTLVGSQYADRVGVRFQALPPPP